MYIMFRSVLFLAWLETAFSLPRTCTDELACPDKQKPIPWTECGEHLPACDDISRCCTEKSIRVTTWSPENIEGIRNGTIHIDAIRESYSTSLLVHAVRSGTDEKLKLAIELIDNGTSVNLQNRNKETALMLAAWGGHADIVKKLLEANALTDLTDEDGKNAVMYASTDGQIAATGLLLDYCAKVSDEALNAASDDLKETLTRAQKNPLIAAVLRKSEGGLEHILQNLDTCMPGKMVNATNDEGFTPLKLAENMNSDEMLKILQAHYTKIGKDLLDAASEGDLDMGTKLLTQGVDIAAQNNAAIVAAVENNHAPFVDFLLEHRASADARNPTTKEPVLYFAAEKNNTGIVSSLVRWGASNSLTNCLDNAQSTACEVETKVCDSALTVAMRNGFMGVVKHLTGGTREGIDQVFCAGSRRYSSLTWASEHGEAEIVRRLLSEGCVDISFQTGGKTSLDIARDTSNADIIGKLEEARWPLITAINKSELSSVSEALKGDECNKMEVNEKKDGKSLLMFAVDLEKKDIVDELIRLKAYVNVKNDGQTALMLAAKKNNAIVKSLLLVSEIDVIALDADGKSALMIAAKGCFTENVKSFVASGKIEIDAIDTKKQTALMHAIQCSAEDVRALLNHGANVGARGDQGRTALMQAVDYCNAPVVSVLLEYDNANLSNMRYEDNETVLMHAVKKCNVSVVKPLVKHSSIQINAKNLAATALMIAVENNRSLSIIKRLLKHPDVSVEPTKRKTDSALVRAVMTNRTDIVKALLLAKADPEVEYNGKITVLGTAVQENVNVKIVKLLLKYNATVDHRFMQRLSMAGRNEEVVEMIQDARWPLLKKIQNRSSGVSIKKMMKSKRHRNKRMFLSECMSFSEPQTMFMTAAAANNTDAMVQLLRLDEGHICIDRTCDSGETPLCIAARNNHVEIAKLLLHECPNVDLRCHKRNYALDIEREHMNSFGKSALEIAKEKKHLDIAEEIRYKKWILLGKIARNGTKSVKELRKEFLHGGHKCDATYAKISYVIDIKERCDRGETVLDWVTRYRREDILAEIDNAFPYFTAPTTTTVTPAPGNTTSTDPKDGDDDDFAWEYLGFLAIIPVCIGIAYAVWRYYPTSTDQASEIPSSKIPSNVASEIPSSKIPSNVASIKTGSMVKSNFKPTSSNNRNHV